MSLTIRWINHAGYVITNHETCILVDPWLTGDAFNNGWSLLSETPSSKVDLDAMHVWFSHEHLITFLFEWKITAMTIETRIVSEKQNKRIVNSTGLGLSVINGCLTKAPSES